MRKVFYDEFTILAYTSAKDIDRETAIRFRSHFMNSTKSLKNIIEEDKQTKRDVYDRLPAFMKPTPKT